MLLRGSGVCYGDATAEAESTRRTSPVARQPTLQQRLRRYGWAWFGPFLILAGLGGSLLREA